jgi:hypothetical protein
MSHILDCVVTYIKFELFDRTCSRIIIFIRTIYLEAVNFVRVVTYSFGPFRRSYVACPASLIPSLVCCVARSRLAPRSPRPAPAQRRHVGSLAPAALTSSPPHARLLLPQRRHLLPLLESDHWK